MEFALWATIRESNNHRFCLLLGGEIFSKILEYSRNDEYSLDAFEAKDYTNVSFLGNMEDTPPGFYSSMIYCRIEGSATFFKILFHFSSVEWTSDLSSSTRFDVDGERIDDGNIFPAFEVEYINARYVPCS